jgi:hypothetical protein
MEPVAASASTSLRAPVAKILGLIFFAVLVPAPLVSALGFGSAGSFIGLAGVGAVTVALAGGLRVALLTIVIAGVAATVLTLASDSWWMAAIVMTVVAAGFGLTARKGWQGGFVPMAIALSFVASDGSQAVEPLGMAAVVLGGGFIIWGAFIAGITHLFFPEPVFPAKPESPRIVAGFIAMLVVATFITQSVAIAWGLGHVGGWLVMTPFIVVLPHVHDGFRKSLRRAAGTIVGFFVVIALSFVTTSHIVLSILGGLAFTAALYAKLRNWNYFFFAAFLTPGIVILEGLSSSLTQLAEYRLEATLAAIALSLFVMAITTVVGRKTSQRSANENLDG